MPSLISISKWFLEERLLASSLSIIGSCILASCYPLLSEWLIRKYGFHEAILVLSALQLNCFVGSVLFNENNPPFSLLDEKIKKKNNQGNDETKSITNSLDPKNNKKNEFKPKTASLTFLIENEVEKVTADNETKKENIQNDHTSNYVLLNTV